MGSSSDKIKVVIIDERKDQRQFFDPILQNSDIKSIYYDSYDKFLEQQSLKKLSYIIIRQDEKIQQDNYKYSNLMQRKKHQNIAQLQSQYEIGLKKHSVTLRERLVTYIRKYSLEKLVIYLIVSDILNYKIPDSEAPYITLVAEKIEHIIDHVKNRPKRQEPFIFKFKRLVKDQYRRLMLSIIEQSEPAQHNSQKKNNASKWKKLVGEHQMEVNFYSKIQDFQPSLISNYSNYIIICNQMMLSYVLDIKKKYKFESKLIFYGKNEELTQQKKNQLWMISNGNDQTDKIQQDLHIKDKSIKSYRQFIIKTIKNCSYVQSEKSFMQPNQVIIYLFNSYDQQTKNYIRTSFQKTMRQRFQKNDDKEWMDKISIQIVDNFSELEQAITLSIYSYLMTIDAENSKIEELKQQIKSQRHENRIYLYNYIPKAEEILVLQNPSDKELIKNTLKSIIQLAIKKANFKIKFEIAPLDSIVLYHMNQKQYKYFSTKLGLLCVAVDQSNFSKNYCSKKKHQIIESYHILCSCQKFFSQLLPMIEKEAADTNNYFNDIKVIIFDQKDAIKVHWKKLHENRFVNFIHFNLSKIEEFINIILVRQLKISIFMKKSLPDYLQALQKVQDSKCRNIRFNGLIVSKNELLKDVFGDENFKISTQYELSFMHLSIGNMQVDKHIITFENFIERYSKLWRIGYNIITDEEDSKNNLKALKEDILKCLNKCKYYSLIEVTDEEFQYFYIKRLNSCETFIDLQITLIFILSLPHGFNKNLDQIFMNPRQNVMISKVFAPYLVALFTCFCSLQDEVMCKQNLVVYVEEGNISNKMIGINPGDILFNNGFVFCGKNENDTQNYINHCFFIQFENIPMLSNTFIKNYLYIQRFSFYKQSTEYLISPYTKFKVKSKNITPEGKHHIHLIAINNEENGFISNIFKYNNINQESLVNTIRKDIIQINSQQNNSRYQKILDEANSLYKKAQIISLNQEKQDMIKSIRDSLEYKKFLIAMKMGKYLTAFNHIDMKFRKKKQTTEIQAVYFKKMLGVEKSYLFYKISEYKMAIKQLQRVLVYLKNEVCQNEEDWLIKKLQYFKNNINIVSIKRNKLLNKMPKTKHWKVYAQEQFSSKNVKASKVMLKMEQKSYQWDSKFIINQQEFYLVKKGHQDIFKCYKINNQYGQAITSFSTEDKYVITTLNQERKEEIPQKKIQKKTSQLKAVQNNQKKEDKKKNNMLATKGSKIIQKEEPKPQMFVQKKEIILQIQSKKDVEEEKQQQKPVKTLPIKQQTKDKKDTKEINNWMIQKAQKNQDSKVSIINISQSQISPLQKAFNITQKVQWQAFYYVDKFLLTKKGKHFKGKVINKIK